MAGGVIVVLLGIVAPVRAQAGVVTVEQENFRAEPGGAVVAELFEGTRLTLGERRGQWREATVEAWIWEPSVREQQHPVLDLLVNAEGENLRDRPNRDRVGRALGGMRLQRLETQGDWLRVRRTGWIWSASLGSAGAEAGAVPPSAPSDTSPPEHSAPAPRPSAREFTTLRGSAILLESLGGDTLARLPSGASVEVLAREGEWRRVRVEGWMFGGTLSDSAGAEGGVLAALHPDSLLERPEQYRGRVVEWTVQFIALQNAERFRTDFLEGEPFVLSRGPDNHPGFVYVAVPAELLPKVERLAPLERLRILGRIRTARSSLTGAPVLDLLEIRGR